MNRQLMTLAAILLLFAGILKVIRGTLKGLRAGAVDPKAADPDALKDTAKDAENNDKTAGQNLKGMQYKGADPGKGADLGGLEGADRHCQTLAQGAGAGSKTWRAYLSGSGANAANARDRIGKGPWQNFKGEVIAKDVDDLDYNLIYPGRLVLVVCRLF